MIKKIIKLSVLAQFTAGKISLLMSLITVSTVLSLKFHCPIYLTISACITAILCLSLFFFLTGWISKEIEYTNRLGTLIEKLDRIEKKLNEM